MDNYRRAPLEPVDLALCEYAERLTLNISGCGANDIQKLRDEGLSDAQISHAVQVIGYFNYINRVAEGLGVDFEPEWKEPGK